jgi:pimeloyl-ACP methyl ester carboxylesterase
MPKVLVHAGVKLEHDTFGSADDPAIVLIAGFGAQLLSWHERFCRLLADEGRFVIRLDNRDCGLSTKLADHPVNLTEVVAAASDGDVTTVRTMVPYTLRDMASDVVGLLDELDIQRAHIVGASLGGMIAQFVAIHHSERTMSLTSMMSSTGETGYGQSTPDAAAALFDPSPSYRSEHVAAAVGAARVWGPVATSTRAPSRDSQEQASTAATAPRPPPDNSPHYWRPARLPTNCPRFERGPPWSTGLTRPRPPTSHPAPGAKPRGRRGVLWWRHRGR